MGNVLLGLITWLALLGGGAGLAVHDHLLERAPVGWQIWVLLGVALYGASLAAVSIRRIVDPQLRIPILAWILIIFDYITSWLNYLKSDQDPRRLSSDQTEAPDDLKTGRPMGRPLAILMVLLGLGAYAVTLWIAHRYYAHAHSA